ncbi:sigma-B regulation protein RsbU (phosphoserine phosphatase) [Actinomadura coerulea]|uniref:Sigma-B regulation protein RsbU (Phosphoserine phosphatase) n=1 Tax=Actinomadura coerulea TaxID=46159 RepID=A0A7X0KZV7_9ACTN|nr:SpoIIE family protein phosphatase [Actinomadura coerulea]MBB6396544.1 sigma-B regulation protein RsbU (phosphoserine phosphatase) [Actinomadura coerulea]
MSGTDEELARLRDLYEHAPCGYLSLTPPGTITKVNQTLLDWTGYRAEDLLDGTRFQELLPVGDRIYYETHFRPLLTMQGEVREIAVDLRCAGGERLPVLVNSTLRPEEPDGAPGVRVCVFRAIDRREYERELLYARRRARESEARARRLAETLQRSFIPPVLPPVPGLEVGDAYRPAGAGDEVGGDFYDVFEISPGRWGLVLGDVCGKGVEAAVVTSLARYTVRAVATEAESPADVLRKLNSSLLGHDAERFCTAVYAGIESGPGGGPLLTVSLGGHPAPILAASSGEVRPIGRPGDLLGVLDDVVLTDETVELRSGDAVLFFTDGVSEARRDREFFGEDRLAGLLSDARASDAGAITARIVDRVLGFQDGVPRDDIALVTLRVP